MLLVVLVVAESSNSYERGNLKMCAIYDRYMHLTNPQKFTEVQKSVRINFLCNRI